MAITKEYDSNNSLDFEESFVNIDAPDVVTTFSEGSNNEDSNSGVDSSENANATADADTNVDPSSGTELDVDVTTQPEVPEATPIPDPIPASVAPLDIQEEYSLPSESNATNVNVDTNQRGHHDENSRQIGAGVVTAVVAAPLLGPVLAVVAGVAAAYGSTQPGGAGDACRAAGDVAMMAKDKAAEVNEKHHVTEKTTEGAKGVITKLRDVNVQYKIVDRVKDLLEASFRHLGEAFKFASGKMRKQRQSQEEKEQSEWDVVSQKDDGRVV
jgi:hypothetical protein